MIQLPPHAHTFLFFEMVIQDLAQLCVKANAQVAGFLFSAAKNGNVTAQIFWLKTRAKWREVPVELRHSGSIGRKRLSEFTDEELIAMLGTAVDLPETKATPEKSSKADVRGFLEVVAGGEYRPKQ